MDREQNGRIDAQLNFLLEADKLKRVDRANFLADGSRRENSAEHSWHVTLMAIVLAECCPEPVCLCRVLELLTIHDLVEIGAGDTPLYDNEAIQSQLDRETAAAEHLFAMLPAGQSTRLLQLWQEFEARLTPEARFARAVDALAPTWLHWGSHSNPSPANLTPAQIYARKRALLEPYPVLWAFFQSIVQSAQARGLLALDR